MSEPIRILQVLGRLDRGGAETMIMNLYRHMDREQLQFDFVIHTEDVCDYTEEVGELGGKIYSMEPFRASTVLGYRKQWRRFFREHPEYRVIHGHMRSTASLYLAEAKRAGLVTIVHSHNTSSGSGFSAVVKNLLQYPLRYQADYLFACGRRAGEWLYGKKACTAPRFRLLPNGIETDRFRFQSELRAKKRHELGIGDEELVFLHIGRMEEQKNHKFLFQIMREIAGMNGKNVSQEGRKSEACGEQKHVRLLLCGCGPLEEELRSQAAADGLLEEDRECDAAAGLPGSGPGEPPVSVRFLGVRDDIPDLMMASDAMIFPSLFEGLPVTVVEAQAAGLPVLMSDTVTDEVILTDLVQTMSLQKSADSWAERALEMAGQSWQASGRSGQESEAAGQTSRSEGQSPDRSSYAQEIRAAGYDVEQSSQWLALVYLSCLKGQSDCGDKA